MPKLQYISKNFRRSSLEVIDDANTIIEEYQDQGFDLTLRQLYYQFVARGLIANKQTSYDRIGSIVNDARLAGMIDWRAIEDRTRNLERNNHWENPKAVLESAADWFELDKWEGQEYYVEVWIEKEALVGVIESICTQWDVPYFACRGYTSQSEQWRAGMRFISKLRKGRKVVVLHFGDHDPSGLDMTRDNLDRLNLFTFPFGEVRINRLALNMDQIEMYNPPANPAKKDDSRFKEYKKEFGDKSWELDALEPSVITGLVDSAINFYVDKKLYDKVERKEARGKKKIRKLAKDYKN